MTEQGNTIFWVAAIILIFVIMSQAGIRFPFAVVTQTICADNTVSSWDFNGNLLDSAGVNNGVNYGATFIAGKSGQAIQFNGTNYIYLSSSNPNATIMWVKNYTAGDANYFFLARINGADYVNGAQSSAKKILFIGPIFGMGLNGSVDNMATFSNLSVSQMIEFYNDGLGRDVCYTVTTEENVTCKDYATSQVTDTGSGCLLYSGDFFPNCDYSWQSTPQYQITNNKCERVFYCQPTCTKANNCYTIQSQCAQNLTYSCYVIQNNVCVSKQDYASCVTGSHYTSASNCQTNVTGTATTTTAAPSSGGFNLKLNEEMFQIAGYPIKLYHLMILLVIIAGYLFINRRK